ncbi:hypothetical protein [Parapedobacter koreensis]|nr:hypothetical protein [Parapedobacter koreensis]
METKTTKPPTYPHRKPLVVDVAICDIKWVQSQPLQSLLKNIIRSPE